jgi:EmrB/QacA subfamily drug resistance transporter
MLTYDINYGRKWYVMVAVAMGVFLATIDGSIVNIALPTLVEALGTNFTTVQWVVLAYLLVVTTLMLSVGRLADMIGKKPIYTVGFIIFTLGSAFCGFSVNILMLIGFRVFQAVGAAMMMALGTAIVTEAFPPTERGKALGIIGSMVSIGVIAGPTLGGILIGSLSWHWIFFVNLPIGILGVILVLRFVPNIKPESHQRFDYLGALTLFVCLISFLAAMTIGQQIGFLQWPIILLAICSIVFIRIFINIELKHSQPMIDLRLFQNKLFSINLATGFLTFVCSAGTVLLMPFYLENALGYAPMTVGLLLAVFPVALGLFAPVAGSLSDRYGPRLIIVIGLSVALCGYFAVSTLSIHTTALGYILRFLLVGIGMGVFQSPNNSAIMGAAPKSSLGVASGLLAVTRTLGQTTGTALLGAIWASRVLSQMNEPLTGGAVSAPAIVQVSALHETLLITVFVIAVSLGLSILGLFEEKSASNPSIR